MSMSDIQTLVIQDEAGKVVDLGVMNPKAHQKSLENKVLWVVHEETGRVLPYREEAGEHRISSIEKADFGYTARLKAGVSGAAGSKVAAESIGYNGAVSGSDESSGSVERSAIIRRLAGVIARRHAEMPEGSYTTHLFTKGPDKIRKKLGEEAVEVILARENEEVIYESADLIYHLLVLLESLDLSIEDVFAELESRE